jgi:hypothetical protein
MERRVIVQEWQKVTEADFNNFGEYPRQSLDHVVGDLLIPDKAFTGFPTVQTAAAEVSVGNGRLFIDGEVYFNDTDGGQVVSLLAVLPTATRRYVAITVWPQEIDTRVEPRTFLTDPVTRATVARAVATERRRWANIATQNGVEGPDPQIPAIAANVLAVAYVLLDTTGIIAIEIPEENRAPTLRGADNRLNENDAWRVRIGTRIDTLASDLAGLALKINGTARQAFVLELARDLARVKETQNLPDTYVGWGADHFVSTDESDTLHVDYLAAVEEGIRFPDAASHSAQIGLLNSVDPNAAQADFFVLPAYDEVPRIVIDGKDAEQNISQYQFQTITKVKKKKSRKRIRVGRWYRPCINWLWLSSPIWRPIVVNVFRVTPIEVLIVTPFDQVWFWPLRRRYVWIDKWTIKYWENEVVSEGVSGAIMGQTFLNAQDGWLTSFELAFTRLAAAGDVRVVLTETTSGGQPDMTKVIGDVVLARADMRLYPTLTKVVFPPTFLEAGGRYGLVLMSGANHYVALVSGNKYAQGSFFYSTDQAWFQGDLVKDLAFRANFARFRAPRVEIGLLGLELSGGIANIDLLAQAIEPPQTDASFEVQVPGQGWVSLADTEEMDEAGHPFNGLPPLLPFRVVLLGTTDSMPGIGVGSNSRVLTRRPRSDFRHISTILDFGAPVTAVQIDVRLEEWRGAPFHTFVLRLLVGAGFATVENADVVEEWPAPDDPENAIMRRYTFSGLTATNVARIRMEGTTDNVLTCFHVAERVHVGT